MARPNKPWFRHDIGWWVTTIARKQYRLAKGKANKAEAKQAFHELMALRPKRPDDVNRRVCDLVEGFLAFYAKPGRVSADTFRNYRFYTQKFAEAWNMVHYEWRGSSDRSRTYGPSQHRDDYQSLWPSC